MNFRQFCEATSPEQLAAMIAGEYRPTPEADIEAIFNRHTQGLPEETIEQVSTIIKQWIAQGKIQLYKRYQYHRPTIPAPQAKVLQDIESRAPKAFLKWMQDQYRDDPKDLQDNLNDPESRTDHINDWLKDEFSIEVREDGLVEFDLLTNRVRRLIGDLPVILYHHTTSKIDKQIRANGILPRGEKGVKKANYSLGRAHGVFLTTKSGGTAPDTYTRGAIQAYRGGDGRTWVVRAYLDDLTPDMDDEDISSGAYQFVVPYVSPRDLVEAI